MVVQGYVMVVQGYVMVVQGYVRLGYLRILIRIRLGLG
jgi:hypothetical protein